MKDKLKTKTRQQHQINLTPATTATPSAAARILIYKTSSKNHFNLLMSMSVRQCIHKLKSVFGFICLYVFNFDLYTWREKKRQVELLFIFINSFAI